MLVILQIAGIVLSVAACGLLLKNQLESKESIRLLLSTIGCLIFGGGALLVMLSDNRDAALTAQKMEYLGNAMFFVFFVSFLIAYMRIGVPWILKVLWGAFEAGVVGIYWNNTFREMFFGTYVYQEHPVYKVLTAKLTPGIACFIRSGVLLAVLAALLICTAIFFLRTQHRAERHRFLRIELAEFAVITMLTLELFVFPELDLLPTVAGISLLAVVVSICTDRYYRVTDSGRKWLLSEMRDPFIMTDKDLCYLDSNEEAVKLFPELKRIKRGESVPEGLKQLFVTDEDITEYEGHYYERKLTQLEDKGRQIGFALLLDDDSDQKEIRDVLEELVEQKTRHIQKVQDSIITGMASVIDSRDDNTGGHIMRTSQVVRIFAQTLKKHTDEFGFDRAFLRNVEKAAPMHDIGKIAIRDELLLSEKRFNDEERQRMKAHSAEGAALLKKVLAEVDDPDFVRISINVAHYHHEAWDGSGYPDGLKGEEIPIEARIMALADVFDALMSRRSYKGAWSSDMTFDVIRKDTGVKFDPRLGKLFLSCRHELEEFYGRLHNDDGHEEILPDAEDEPEAAVQPQA